MVGTFSGNPLAMAATRAMLTEVATDAMYARITRLARRMHPASSRSSRERGLDAHVVSVGGERVRRLFECTSS